MVGSALGSAVVAARCAFQISLWPLAFSLVLGPLMILPFSLIARQAAEDITRAHTVEKQCHLPLHFYAWDGDSRMRYQGSTSLLLYWVARGIAFALVGVLTYSIVAAIAIGSSPELAGPSHRLRSMVIASTGLFSLMCLADPAGVWLNLRGVVDMSFTDQVLAKYAWDLVSWGPGITFILSCAVPTQTSRPVLKCWIFTFVTTALYSSFWFSFFMMNELRNLWVKAAIAAVVPGLLGGIVMEIYFYFSDSVLGLETNAGASTLLMTIPAAWLAAMQAVLQLGSFDLRAAIVLEVIGFVLETKSKVALMRGVLPLRVPLDTLGGCWRRCKKMRLGALPVVPEGCPTAVVPNGSPTFTSEQQSRDDLRRSFLSGVVCCSNISEMLVHMLVAFMFIAIPMNPAQRDGSRIPWTHTVLFFGIKIGFEVFTDAVIIAWAWGPEQHYDVGSTFSDLTVGTKVGICIIAACMFSDLSAFTLTFLCPCRGPEVVSLSSCPGGTFVRM